MQAVAAVVEDQCARRVLDLHVAVLVVVRVRIAPVTQRPVVRLNPDVYFIRVAEWHGASVLVLVGGTHTMVVIVGAGRGQYSTDHDQYQLEHSPHAWGA